MTRELSQHTEQYLASVVAGGLFPSKEAALEAAVEALREKNEAICLLPDEHRETVEQAIEQANAGRSAPMTKADWATLRQLAKDVAADKSLRGG